MSFISLIIDTYLYDEISTTCVPFLLQWSRLPAPTPFHTFGASGPFLDGDDGAPFCLILGCLLMPLSVLYRRFEESTSKSIGFRIHIKYVVSFETGL